MDNLGKQSGGSVDPVEDPPPAAVPTQDQSTSESLVDSSAQQQQQQPRPPPPLSPLTGCYLLIVVGEPHSDRHKEVILQKIAKAFLSWDVNQCHVSLEKELQILVAQSPEGEEARFGERLIQYATENLVTEILIHPQLNTLHQCMKNLLSSFSKHRHIVHAGYTFAGNGSWILQAEIDLPQGTVTDIEECSQKDGTLSVSDLVEALHEPEVIRVLKAYGNSVSIDVHCASEGDWTTERFQKEAASKLCTVRINPGDVMTAGNPAISSFINYLSPFLVPANIQHLLQPTDVVGNIRFTHPTLYVFPGGQGDAALFGINGFNMLIDGGFARKACFWDFARHLDRLDAVLLTRLNNSTVNGISAVLQRKKMNHVYPQIGHFFCNLQDRKIALSPDGDKDKDSLIVNLAEEGQEIVANLRHLALKPHPCYRDGNQVDPVNLYHKVGHGKLDMYVISPARDSQAVKEFLSKWTTNDSQLFSNTGKKTDGKAFEFPLQNLVSICALLVWQPANPNDTITRILFPGSTPQHKIFEGLEKLRHLEFLKHPVCTARSISPSSSAVSMTRSVSKSRQPKLAENKIKETKPVGRSQVQPPTQPQPKLVKAKVEKSPPKEVKEIPSTVVEEKKEVEKPTEESPKRVDNRIINKEEQIENIKDEIQKIEQTETDESKKKVVHKSKYDMRNVKPKVDSRAPSKSVDRKKVFERKPGGGWPSPPGTPKKAPLNGTASKAEKSKAGAPKPIARAVAVASSSSATSPTVTPAKSAKEANNRKVVEARASATKSPPKPAPVTQKKDGIPPTPAPQPLPQPPPAPVHRRQVRRPRVPQSPVRATRATRRVVKRPDIDPDVVRTYDPSIDVELGLGVETLKTDLIRQVTRGLDENQETEERAVMGGMNARQAEEEEAKLKRDEEETEDVETDEPEEYLIITRQVIDYPPPQGSTRGTIITRETREVDPDELEKLIREEIECEKEEDVFLPDDVPVQDQQGSEPAKEEVKEKTTDEPQAGDKTPEGGESEIQKLMDVDEGIDLKEPVSKEHKEGESLPEEKISNTVETSATTAPTLPEDERMEEPMLDEAKLQQDETKEVVEEKYTQEETKEDKQQNKIEEVELKQPPTLPDIGAEDVIVTPQTTQKKRHPRDVVKTPDEVADLPMHEEVDPGMYSSGDFMKELQRKAEEDDQTPTEAKPDFNLVAKGEVDLLEKEDERSEKSEESKKAIEKAEEPTKEEKDGPGESITSQYLNIIDKLEKSVSESKKDVPEDTQLEGVDEKIMKESEVAEKEDEKTLEKVSEVISKTEEPEIPEEEKLQFQDEVKADEKLSPNPAKETEIMPKEDEDVSDLFDSKTSLKPDLSGKSTPQEPEIFSGKSSPLALEKEMSGKAIPLDLEKESSGKATPADLTKDVSGKSTPQDKRKGTPVDLEKESSGKVTPVDLAKDVSEKSIPEATSGKVTPVDWAKDVSEKSLPEATSGKATPADLAKDVSGKSTPQDEKKDTSQTTSGKATPVDLVKHTSEKSTPQATSGKVTPLDLEKESSGKATPADLDKNVSGKSTPQDVGKDTSRATSGKATPTDFEKDVSGKSIPQDGRKNTSQATSGKSTPMDLETTSRRHSQVMEKEFSGKSTPIDSVLGKTSPQDVTGKSTPLELVKDLSGKVTPLEMERSSSRKSSRDEKVSIKSGHSIEKDDSDKSEPNVASQNTTATPQEMSKDISGKSTPRHLEDEPSPSTTPQDLEVKPTPSDDTSGGPTPHNVTSGKATPVDSDKSEGIVLHDMKRKSITQDVDSAGKITPLEVGSGKATPKDADEFEGITPHDIKRKSITQDVDSSGKITPSDVGSGNITPDAASGKATPMDADKSEGIIPYDIKRKSITQDVDSTGKITPSDVASGKSSRRESAVDDYDDRRSSLQSLVSDKPMEAPSGISSGKSSPTGKDTSRLSEEQLIKEGIPRKGSSEKDFDEEVQEELPESHEVSRDIISYRKTSIQDVSGKVTPSDVTGSEAVMKSESYETCVQEKDAVGKKMTMVESSVSDSVSSGPPEKDVSGKSTPFSTDKETSALGGKVTSDSFSVALAEKGTSGTYSLEKESGDKSSSPSPVDISPLSLDELKETPKEKKSGETDEKDVVDEPEDVVETERVKEGRKSIGEATTSFMSGRSPILERIRHEEGESSGTSSPDRSLPEKSEGSLPNGMESEEECEKGILESEKHEKESQILDISSGEEEELKALGVDDDDGDGDSETETQRKPDDVEEDVEIEEGENYVAKPEKEDIEISEKAEKKPLELEVGEKPKVKRMLITASSEDGGTETEIIIQESAKFIKKETTALAVEKAEEVVEEEAEGGGDFSNLILQAKMEYNSQRSRKSSYNSLSEDAEGDEKLPEKEIRNGGETKEGEEEEEEEELGTLMMQARQELAFVRSKSRESQLSQPEMTKLEKTTTTTTTTKTETTRLDDDNDIITITTILTEEREEQEDGSVKVTTTKETTTTGGKDEGSVVNISTEFETKKTEEEKSQVNSATSESGMDRQRSGKGDGEGKTSQEEVTTETSRRTSASSIISQEDLVSRKDSAKIEDFRQSSTEMSPLKTTYITSHGDSESLMTSSFYGNLPTEDEMIGKSEHHSREFRRGKGYESVTEVGPNGERMERTYFYGTEEDPTRMGRDRSRYVKAYYTEEEHHREGDHSRIGVKYLPSDIPEEEGTTERTRFVQHYYKEEEEEPKVETETKLRFVQTFSGEGAIAEHVDFAKAIDEHISARGEYLGKEIRQDVARYTNGKREVEPEDEEEEEATASGQEKDKKKDIIHEWGKPLGLPLPPRNKTCTFPRQNISTTSSLSTPSDNSDSVTNWGQPMSLPSPAPPAIQNGVAETLPAKPKEPSKMEKKVHMKKNISGDNKSSGNNTPNRRSESPVKQSERRTPSTGRSGRTGNPYLYLDLTYVPHHGNSYYSNVEFFKKIRARYYVFSGTEPSKEVYNALLEAKQTWEDKKLEVTIIPTYDTDVLGYWVAENEEILAKHKIDLSPSASRCTINLQDHETSCSAYRLEF